MPNALVPTLKDSYKNLQILDLWWKEEKYLILTERWSLPCSPDLRLIQLQLLSLPGKPLFSGVAAWVPTGPVGDHIVKAVPCFTFLSLENIILESHLIPPEQTALKSAQEMQ